MISQTIRSISAFGAKYLAIGFLFASGVILALLAAYAFQTNSVSPTSTGTGLTDDKNTSLTFPMLTKSGGTFDRNTMSLEAIANNLGLPSPGSSKRIFVTSTTYTGDLKNVAPTGATGLLGADAKCQARATAGWLSGTWKAILSDSTTSAASRLNTNFMTTINIKGEVIALNPLKTGMFGLWKTKTNASAYEIRWPLITNEFWVYTNPNATFWSNTDKDGGIYPNSPIFLVQVNCQDWTYGTYASCAATSMGRVWFFWNTAGYGFNGYDFFTHTYVAAYGIQYSSYYSICANGTYVASYSPTSASETPCNSLYRLLCQEQ